MGVVYGVGNNDADYVVQPIINGKRVVCPYYRTWFSMMVRCYSPSEKKRNPTYMDCYADSRWLSFMSFKEWMKTQDWEGKQLDKDLLVSGNKVYSPETCIFVTHQVNAFMTENKRSTSKYPLGVTSLNDNNDYIAKCHALGKGQIYLGTYSTADEAHNVYLKFKSEQAIELAALQTDYRIAKALLYRYVL